MVVAAGDDDVHATCKSIEWANKLKRCLLIISKAASFKLFFPLYPVDDMCLDLNIFVIAIVAVVAVLTSLTLVLIAYGCCKYNIPTITDSFTP